MRLGWYAGVCTLNDGSHLGARVNGGHPTDNDKTGLDSPRGLCRNVGISSEIQLLLGHGLLVAKQPLSYGTSPCRVRVASPELHQANMHCCRSC